MLKNLDRVTKIWRSFSSLALWLVSKQICDYHLGIRILIDADEYGGYGLWRTALRFDGAYEY